MQASPEPSPAAATALRILKGALCAVLSIPQGGTTYSVKYKSPTSGTLGVKVSTVRRPFSTTALPAPPTAHPPPAHT